MRKGFLNSHVHEPMQMHLLAGSEIGTEHTAAQMLSEPEAPRAVHK